MFQRLRNLLPPGSRSGTGSPRSSNRRTLLNGSQSPRQRRETGNNTPNSIDAALALWTLNLDVHLFLDKIIINDLIYDLIFDACTPQTLVRLLETCRATNIAVKDYISRAFNINRLLSRYFSDPMAFRYLQACTGTLISGSTALQFFNRSFYPDSDLDIYVPMAWRSQVGHFLLEQGYKFAPNSVQHPTFDVAVSERRVVNNRALYGKLKGIAGIFTFKKQSASGNDLKVQIMVAVRTPMEIILQFHSTCVMNVISFDKAYCLYPRATLEEHRSLVLNGNDELVRRALLKYSQRGWTMVYWPRLLEYSRRDPSIFDHPRWIDDGFSWSIPLPYSFDQPITPLNPHSARLTRDPVSASSWEIQRAPDLLKAEVVFYNVKKRHLFYQYIVHHERVIGTPPVEALMKAAQRANPYPASNTLVDDRRFIDERFIELAHDYYRIMH